ncbi:hypothetical protein OG285_15260 [Streptomyces sp. NBC_01471]|uniref:hypothetical protein n=1 Tax=Streptomyces sp. NBC_01471 TaxID=2903879 RepID=UPI00324737B5
MADALPAGIMRNGPHASFLAWPKRGKGASFTYTGSSSAEVSEELCSDSAAKLSKGIGKVFDAMLSCPS